MARRALLYPCRNVLWKLSSLSFTCTMASGPTDARWSTINNVGHDQQNVYINVTIDSSVPERERYHLLRELCVPRSTKSILAISSERRILSQTFPFETGSTGDIACGFIDRINQSLCDRAESTDQDFALKAELQSLRQTLTLADLAMQTFEYTPIGRNLAKSVSPEMEKCRIVLQELYNSKTIVVRVSFQHSLGICGAKFGGAGVKWVHRHCCIVNCLLIEFFLADA